MKKRLILFAFLCLSSLSYSQKKPSEPLVDTKKIMTEILELSCRCIDSIETLNVNKDTITARIHACIDKNVATYQIGEQMAAISIDDMKDDNGNKNIQLTMNYDPESKEYKETYYSMQRYLMANCSSLKEKVATDNGVSDKSISQNPEARKYYTLAMNESEKGNFKEAINYYKKSIKADKNFAFAYDNMGVSYRKLNDFDNAIDAYKKSLEINPEGALPLQNIAVAYQYKKDYKNAVKAFEKLAKINPDNPEIYYGIGQIYAFNLNEQEKGLENLCKAYTLYITQNSPYRTDAEALIQRLHTEMEKDGKEAKFNEILKNNNITPN